MKPALAASPALDRRRIGAPLALTALALASLLAISRAAAAQPVDSDWQFRASVYGFFPAINGRLRVPVPSGGDIDVDAQDLVDNLKFAAMGSFEAQKGRWGLFADAIHMNVGDSIADSPTFAQGNVALPPGVTADASLDIKATVVTAAANYRAIATPTSVVDVFAGARYLHAEGELEWRFDTPMGPLPPPTGQGRGEVGKDGWDGVIGLKGRYRFGARRQWFVPFYLDAGTGDSDLTWQAAGGIGYAARWGETFLVWRHLDYDFGRDRAIDELQFSGPTLGVAFSW